MVKVSPNSYVLSKDKIQNGMIESGYLWDHSEAPRRLLNLPGNRPLSWLVDIFMLQLVTNQKIEYLKSRKFGFFKNFAYSTLK